MSLYEEFVLQTQEETSLLGSRALCGEFAESYKLCHPSWNPGLCVCISHLGSRVTTS